MNQVDRNQHERERDQRRKQRKPVDITVPVIDVISGQALGRVGNLSGTGMLLLSLAAPQSEAIHQVYLPLPGTDTTPQYIEVGIQEQWHRSAASGEPVWAGYRIIAMGEGDDARLDAWLALPN